MSKVKIPVAKKKSTPRKSTNIRSGPRKLFLTVVHKTLLTIHPDGIITVEKTEESVTSNVAKKAEETVTEQVMTKAEAT